MKVATVDRPAAVRAAEMGLQEAQEITQTIKDNFDSLGSMLLLARDRKAYKALGYRSFEGYCQTEFGKPISSAYRLIEDAKALAEIEAEIAKQYDEPITLKIPSSQLRPLKELPEIGDKLRAIEYATNLAANDGKKQPTKKHLEIAVFQISGQRSEDFKSAIESLGFTKDTPVEVIATSRKDRGFIKKIDQRGKIHIELYNGGAATIPYDSNQLRILGETEKPAIPTSDYTVKKGDKVKIFARGLEGKTGEIYIWKMGKHAMVVIDGQSAPTDIAYAELELIQKEAAIEVGITNKWQDAKWTFKGNDYYYFEKENRIRASGWPIGLNLEPYSQGFDSPAKFMDQWLERFAPWVVKALTNKGEMKALEDLKKENNELHARLAEAEAVIEELVKINIKKSNPGDTTATELSVDNAASIDSVTGNESWLSVLESNDFTQNKIELNGEPTENYRGWDIYTDDSSVADIDHPSKGTFSVDFSWSREDKEIINPVGWIKNIINQVEDFCPGQLSLLKKETEIIDNSTTQTSPETLTFEETFSTELLEKLLEKEKKLLAEISIAEKTKAKAKAKELQKIEANITWKKSLNDNLGIFLKFRINQRVKNKTNEESGTVTGVSLTSGSMPQVFVRWDDSETSFPEMVDMLTILDL